MKKYIIAEVILTALIFTVAAVLLFGERANETQTTGPPQNFGKSASSTKETEIPTDIHEHIFNDEYICEKI